MGVDPGGLQEEVNMIKYTVCSSQRINKSYSEKRKEDEKDFIGT